MTTHLRLFSSHYNKKQQNKTNTMTSVGYTINKEDSICHLFNTRATTVCNEYMYYQAETH